MPSCVAKDIAMHSEDATTHNARHNPFLSGLAGDHTLGREHGHVVHKEDESRMYIQEGWRMVGMRAYESC